MKRIIILLSVVSILFLAACAAPDAADTGTEPSLGMPAEGFDDVPEMIVADESSGDNEAGDASGSSEAAPADAGTKTKEFTVRAFQFGFEPDTLTVNKGDNVIIHAYSSDVPHGFAIPEYGVNLQLFNDEKKTAEFTADKAGEFGFFCSIPCGSGHGKMRGRLIVE